MIECVKNSWEDFLLNDDCYQSGQAKYQTNLNLGIINIMLECNVKISELNIENHLHQFGYVVLICDFQINIPPSQKKNWIISQNFIFQTNHDH